MDSDPGPLANAALEIEVDLKKTTVLVVEDEEVIRHAICAED
jgi:hypothetical protein|tara:strand:- start:932 stop:1057 length:126 start_codon:yes stop_codon:yes gene_type:complete